MDSIDRPTSLGYASVPTAQEDKEIAANYSGRGVNSFRDTSFEHSALVLALQPVSSQALRQWQMDNAEQIMDVSRQEALTKITECHVSTHTQTTKNTLGPAYSMEVAQAVSSHTASQRDVWNQCISQNG